MPTAAELQEDMLNPKVDYDRILRKYRSGGVAEIASENPNVASYCREWEERAETAEAQLAARDRELAMACELLKSIRLHHDDRKCGHKWAHECSFVIVTLIDAFLARHTPVYAKGEGT